MLIALFFRLDWARRFAFGDVGVLAFDRCRFDCGEAGVAVFVDRVLAELSERLPDSASRVDRCDVRDDVLIR